jgi:hypothetical protein
MGLAHLAVKSFPRGTLATVANHQGWYEAGVVSKWRQMKADYGWKEEQTGQDASQ